MMLDSSYAEQATTCRYCIALVLAWGTEMNLRKRCCGWMAIARAELNQKISGGKTTAISMTA